MPPDPNLDSAVNPGAAPAAASPWRFCVAPMMEATDRHFRFFLRLLSRHARLYTEMIATPALINGKRARYLKFDRSEHPVALQLGGSDVDELAQCAEFGAEWGYDEINLNCGCPSDRVQENSFGACLMREPDLVAEGVAAMRRASSLPVTVKTRIGVDDSEDYVFLRDFVETVAQAGCEVFIIHARKAWLKGLSPKENREIPPLRYEIVQQLKQDFPRLTIVINGGIRTLDQCTAHLQGLDGVMLGREIYDNPYLIGDVDHRLFGDARTPPTRLQVLRALLPYAEAEVANGTRIHHITRHILGLYRGEPGGRAFRRLLSEGAADPRADAELLLDVIDQFEGDEAPHLQAA